MKVGSKNSREKLSGMNDTDKQSERVAKMTFASVYPHYIAKVEKKGRTIEELQQVIEWLTGYNSKTLQALIDEKVTFEMFFEKAALHPNAPLITGLICGYRIEDIENPLMRQVRYLDKLVDELAKGKKMEKILRSTWPQMMDNVTANIGCQFKVGSYRSRIQERSNNIGADMLKTAARLRMPACDSAITKHMYS